ncbi:MAG: ECF transporter S component [Ruminococcaceae bacterium]|nr:ECF transporter S component [Oscillospiraceae bacterium]
MKYIKKLVYAALCLALALYLPFLTGQIPEIGSALSPMHIPILLCGFICGWQYGIIAGFIAPLLRHMLFSMPPMPMALIFAFEFAAYGCAAGILYGALPKKIAYTYVSLVGAMLCGRVVWGIGRFVLAGINQTEFPFSAFLAGAFIDAFPGIVLHIVLIPPIVISLKKAKLI